MSWTPCSGLDSAAGVVWLPRMLQKARRALGSPDGRVVDGYLYGDNDFIDKQVIAFLRTDDETISALVRANPSDEDVARILVERSGRSAEECAAYSGALKRKFLNFFMLEADEGRAQGFKASVVKFLYNNAMMPIVYPIFRRDERKRKTAARA